MQPQQPPSQFKIGCIKAAQLTLSAAAFAGGCKVFWDDMEANREWCIAHNYPKSPLTPQLLLGTVGIVGGILVGCHACCPCEEDAKTHYS